MVVFNSMGKIYSGLFGQVAIRQRIFGLVALVSLFLIFLPSLSHSQEVSAYSLSHGDIIGITVFGEEELSIEAQLNDLGVISFPFLGDIEVLGLTIADVQRKIEQGLSDGYLVNPKVRVSITQYRRFYVSGEVRQPDGFAFIPGLTVRQAISLAGGFTPRAAKTKIYIVSDERSDGNSRKVDLDSLVTPGDVITVNQRFF